MCMQILLYVGHMRHRVTTVRPCASYPADTSNTSSLTPPLDENARDCTGPDTRRRRAVDPAFSREAEGFVKTSFGSVNTRNSGSKKFFLVIVFIQGYELNETFLVQLQQKLEAGDGVE